MGGGGGHEDRFSRDPFPFFFSSAGGPCEQFWHGQRCPVFDVVHPAFSLPTTASPSPQGALKAVMVCDMPEPCKFRLLTVARRGSCGPKRKLSLLRTQSLVLISMQKMRRSFLMHFGLESLDPFFRVSKQSLRFTAVEENGDDKRLVELYCCCCCCCCC